MKIRSLINSIRDGKFAWERYLRGKRWRGIELYTCPLFCSYGQIGYSVSVFEDDQHVMTITHDWELGRTKCENHRQY